MSTVLAKQLGSICAPGQLRAPAAAKGPAYRWDLSDPTGGRVRVEPLTIHCRGTNAGVELPADGRRGDTDDRGVQRGDPRAEHGDRDNPAPGAEESSKPGASAVVMSCASMVARTAAGPWTPPDPGSRAAL